MMAGLLFSILLLALRYKDAFFRGVPCLLFVHCCSGGRRGGFLCASLAGAVGGGGILFSDWS